MKRSALRAGRCLAGIVLGLAASCGTSSVFTCRDDAQCVDGDQLGRCEASGYCSFPDPGCPSGYRYSEHAADRFADTCVPPTNASGSTTDDGDGGDSGPSGSPSSGATDPTLDSTGADDAVSATMPTDTSEDDGSTSHLESTSTSGAGPTSDDPTDPTRSTSDESTTEPPGDPYEECLDVTECTYPEATCMYDTWALPVCNPPCSGAGDSDACPAPADGDAVPACRDIAGGQWGCILDCTVGGCPAGMFCGDSTLGPFCFWA